MQLTDQQNAILDEVQSGTGHLAIVARAGCGKTATILFAVDKIVENFPNSETTICAFNKAIADEVRDKLQARGHKNFRQVGAATLHSLGFNLVRFVYNNPKVEENKVRDIVNKLNTPEAREYHAQIVQLVKIGKQEGFGFFDDRAIGDAHAWYKVIDHYNLNGFEETSHIDDVVALAQIVYKQSLAQTDVVDFDDMILFPLIKNLRVKFQKDFLFVDEAQDLSRVRQALAKKFVKPSGRMIIVGDDRQAIYGFAGADAAALSNLQNQLKTKTLPLSVTWRCPKRVVELAQSIVPDIEYASTAEDGEVKRIVDLPNDLGPETAVLCRNMAPLIDLAYSLIRKGTPAKVEGRDIGEGLKKMLGRWQVKTIDAYLQKLEQYRERETQKAQAKGKDAVVEQINDKCETLRVICDECMREGKSTVGDAVRFVDNLFADGADHCTVLATYHRSKGREWPRVILLQHEQRCPSPYAKQEWQIEQEYNLAYVAITRAQSQLMFLG